MNEVLKSSNLNNYDYIEEEKQSISNEKNQKKSTLELTHDLIQLDLEKIRECISILEEYRLKCVEEENFSKAKEALERINQFKKIEEEKMKIELFQWDK